MNRCSVSWEVIRICGGQRILGLYMAATQEETDAAVLRYETQKEPTGAHAVSASSCGCMD